MTNAKKSVVAPVNEKKNKSKGSGAKLFVQVYQGPALQCEAAFSVNSSQQIKLGPSRKANLRIPFSQFPHDYFLFHLTKWGAKVRLEPRMDGFVSDGQRFGSVRDFTAPRGALKELATVLEPLEVSIPEGSRGSLNVSGYTVIFRVAKPKPVATVPKVQGAPKAPFALPYGQSPMERAGFFLGTLAITLVAVPALAWLNKAPIHRFSGLGDLSPSLAAEIIHPDHFQILPWAFASEFKSNAIVSQAVQWVDELSKKWQSEEDGRIYEARIPVLKGLSVAEDPSERLKRWQAQFNEKWQQVERQRDTAVAGSFLRGQKEYAPLQVTVAGKQAGSITERVRARLARMDRTRDAAISMLEVEHIYMKNYFKEEKAEIHEIFDPPKEEGLFFRLAEKAFFDERENFRAAESYAALARKKQKIGMTGQQRTLAGEHSHQQKDERQQSLVWSGESLTLASILTLPSQEVLAGGEAQMFKNAELSLGTIAPPPAPKPVAKISLAAVETFVRSRSPEVKACYDAALARNPRLGGTIVWSWTIAENGRLLKSRVNKTTISDPVLTSCLDKKVRSWNFPKPVNGAITITFPFKFLVRENRDTLDRMAR
jgi:hypothetical protein